MVQPVMRAATSRLSNLNPREKKMLIGGTLVALLLLFILLWPSGEGDPSNVELVPADQRGGGSTSPPVAPTPLPVTPVPVVPVAPVAAAAAVPEGLRLFGVTGRGAIIGGADGGQRYVALGREIAPGLRLQAVTVHHAILATPTSAYRLGFNGAAVALAPPAAPATPPAGVPAPPGQAAITNPVEARRMAAERGQTAQFQQILSPRQMNGRTSGYTLRPGASVPALQQAGLQPGDTILAVNGTPLGPEQLQELAWTINNSTRTQFVVERAGRRMELTLDPGR